jgi:hypothetical protein
MYFWAPYRDCVHRFANSKRSRRGARPDPFVVRADPLYLVDWPLLEARGHGYNEYTIVFRRLRPDELNCRPSCGKKARRTCF